jgi:alanyl-tRNA synthetase
MMQDQRAYLDDPLKFEFQAEIVQKTRLADGQFEVILEKTYFYPTGGGQTHDTGFLGDARVVDVFKDQAENVTHRVDRDILNTTVTGKIDQARRLGNMQHHSAQHLMSRALEEVLGLETVSVKISADAPSTVDVEAETIDQADLAKVEALVNKIIFENRPIKSYFITDEQIPTVPFRRPPKVTGEIRVVEIDSFDYSACGGTHCTSTGMIGLVKIIKTESKGKRFRIHFVAGTQALTFFQNYHDIITTISRRFSTSPEELVKAVTQQSEQLQSAQRELKALQAEMLRQEGQRLIQEAVEVDGIRLVLATFKDRSLADLRELGKLVQEGDGVVTLLAAYDGQKLFLIVNCAGDTGLSAKELLTRQLTQIGGKGGGDARFAQGGGEAAKEQVEAFFANTRDYIRAMKEKPGE